MSKDILQQGFEAVAKSLVEFGYPDVTATMIEEAHGRWKKGETERSNIIDMMAGGQFDDYPQVFGEPDA